MNIERRTSRVLVYLYSVELKQLFGSYKLEVALDEQRPRSIEEIFRNVKSAGGVSLSDVLIESGCIKPRYAVFMGGRNIETMQGTKTPVPSGESVAVLEVVARITGGCYD